MVNGESKALFGQVTAAQSLSPFEQLVREANLNLISLSDSIELCVCVFLLVLAIRKPFLLISQMETQTDCEL